MPNLDNLMEQVAEIINTENEVEVRFPSMDIRCVQHRILRAHNNATLVSKDYG